MSFFPFASPLHAQRLSDQRYRSLTRSMVVSKLGIVSTSQALAPQAGAQILAQGGSAADAANAALGVVEPMMDGIGGDLFATEWDAKSGKLNGLNAGGWAPEKLTRRLLKGKGFDYMPGRGILSVTVPGCVRSCKVLCGCHFGSSLRVLAGCGLRCPRLDTGKNGYGRFFRG